MHETSKASKRRLADTNFDWKSVFKGKGLDVGSGDDPLQIPSCIPFDLPDGGGDDITRFFPYNEFDFIHGSQVLEHAISPNVMLRTWLDALKPKGFIIATVPDWVLYEGRVWPSQWNQGHTHAWTLDFLELGDERASRVPLVLVPSFLECFDVNVLRCELIDTNYNYDVGANKDQTLDPDKGVEAFIEFVLQKK